MIKNRLVSGLIIMACLIVSSCGPQYFGYTKDEWNKLSKRDKRDAKEDFNQIIKDKNTMVFGDPIEEATQAFEDRASSTH
ncbi:MAG: hypothetical protein ACI93R_001306 [Flavobacteriales bacterium]|jgi:hypothetical protein